MAMMSPVICARLPAVPPAHRCQSIKLRASDALPSLTITAANAATRRLSWSPTPTRRNFLRIAVVVERSDRARLPGLAVMGLPVAIALEAGLGEQVRAEVEPADRARLGVLR
jgi:hypothetical protein